MKSARKIFLYLLYIHQNNIRTDLTNLRIRNNILRFFPKRAKQMPPTGYHNLLNASAALINFQITNMSEFSTIFYTNYFFTFQFRIQHVPPFCPCSLVLIYAPSLSYYDENSASVFRIDFLFL